MTCPVCKRELAPTLSICFACGAMVHDTVREELETKIGRISGPLAPKPVKAVISTAPVMAMENKSEPTTSATPNELTQISAEISEPRPAKPVRSETKEFGNKKTSPTLVGFQPKNPSIPDWRLQLQNSVRQRKTDTHVETPAVALASAGFQTQVSTKGANAIKPQFVEAPETQDHENPRVANALRRIENSRRQFLPGEKESSSATITPSKVTPSRNYPFNVVSRSGDIATKSDAPHATVNTPPKPRLVSSLKIEKKKYDTNKLPPLFKGEIRPEIEPIAEITEPVSVSLKVPLPVGVTYSEPTECAIPDLEVLPMDEEYEEENEDLAPISSRLLAGLFDMIIGGFTTAIVLSPLLISDRPWMSVSGGIAIAAAFGIVMFLYLTISIGFRGRTLGMKLFSLEIVDAEENEYPTLHQAAVNSAVFLLSLPLLGIGLVPAFINEERRAAHDLISGTILVKEI